MIWYVEVVEGAQAQWIGGAVVGVLALSAWRWGVSTAAWISAFTVSLGVGARLGAWWTGALSAQEMWGWGHPGGVSSFGAVFGGAFVVAFARRFGPAAAAPLVFTALVLEAFARAGCVFSGCDFGAPATWGLAYARPAPAWQHHVMEAAISAAHAHSLPTLPFPAVDATVALFASALAWRGDRDVRAVWVAIGVYLLGRFGAEFLRAPGFSPEFLGLNRPQWFCVVGFVTLAVYLRGRRVVTVSDSDSP